MIKVIFCYKFFHHSVSISLALVSLFLIFVSFFLTTLHKLQLKSSSSLMSWGLRPMQKRWYQSSHLSHCTQWTCFPVGFLHFGEAEQSSSESAEISAAILASSFFFFFNFFFSLPSDEV